MLNLNFPLRVLQAAVAVATLGFNGYITNWYLQHTRPSICPTAPLYLLAVAAISLVTLPYLTFNPPLQVTHSGRRSNPRFFNKWIVLALEAIICVLWLASWIKMAVFRAGLILCPGHICGYMGWGTALGVVAFIAYFVTTVLASLHVLRTRGNAVQAQQTHHDAWVGVEQKQEA